MTRVLPVVVAAILLVGMVVAAQGQLNFASKQATKNLDMEPGETIATQLNFWNDVGVQVTHVLLEVVAKPEGWNVTLSPPAAEYLIEAFGVPTTIKRNLCVNPPNISFCEESPPGNPVSVPPAKVPAGVEYLTLAGVTGLVPTRVVALTVEMPKSSQIGRGYGITVRGTAQWATGTTGQAGVGFTQQRDFVYNVNAVQRGYTERTLGRAGESPAPTGGAVSPGAGPVVTTVERVVERERVVQSEVPQWVYLIVAVLAVVVVAQVALGRRRRR